MDTRQWNINSEADHMVTLFVIHIKLSVEFNGSERRLYFVNDIRRSNILILFKLLLSALSGNFCQ